MIYHIDPYSIPYSKGCAMSYTQPPIEVEGAHFRRRCPVAPRRIQLGRDLPSWVGGGSTEFGAKSYTYNSIITEDSDNKWHYKYNILYLGIILDNQTAFPFFNNSSSFLFMSRAPSGLSAQARSRLTGRKLLGATAATAAKSPPFLILRSNWLVKSQFLMVQSFNPRL